MTFRYKGIFSKLDLKSKNINDFIIIIDYMFDKYNIKENLNCEVICHERDKPEFFGEHIALSTDGSLNYYQQIDFQFSHELVHLIQYHKGLIKVERLDYNSVFEIEARNEAKHIMHEILGYKNYIISDWYVHLIWTIFNHWLLFDF